MRKIVICDDLEEERERLKTAVKICLAKLGEEAEITEYGSGIPLLSDVQEGIIDMDLLFLDITVWRRPNGCARFPAGCRSFF